MTTGSRTIVKHAPAKMSHPTAYRFFHDLQPLLMANRSYLVLDFSQVREIDSAGVGVLLRCLEEVMKGNGDIKLAAIPPEALVVLELTGVDSLFEIFDNASDAVGSFRVFAGGTLERAEQLPVTLPAAA